MIYRLFRSWYSSPRSRWLQWKPRRDVRRSTWKKDWIQSMMMMRESVPDKRRRQLVLSMPQLESECGMWYNTSSNSDDNGGTLSKGWWWWTEWFEGGRGSACAWCSSYIWRRSLFGRCSTQNHKPITTTRLRQCSPTKKRALHRHLRPCPFGLYVRFGRRYKAYHSR